MPIDVVHVDMINHDVLNHHLNTSQVSGPQKFDDSTSAIGNGSGGHSGNSGVGQREFFDEANINATSMEDHNDDLHRLMKLANYSSTDGLMKPTLGNNSNDDIKIKIQDLSKLESCASKDGLNVTEDKSTTNIYESDDEEKNCAKTTFKNTSREEQFKLIPSLDKSSIEMSKLKGSYLSGQSEFETSREMGFQELEEKYLHYKKTA